MKPMPKPFEKVTDKTEDHCPEGFEKIRRRKHLPKVSNEIDQNEILQPSKFDILFSNNPNTCKSRRV